MTKDNTIILEWDWKGQPDWNTIHMFLLGLNETPDFYPVTTNDDSYGLIISLYHLNEHELRVLWNTRNQ